MGLAIAGLQALDRHVGAQDLLDAAQVGTGLEQVGSGAVAEAVRAGIPGPSRLAQAPVHDPAGRARVQAAAPYAEENRGCR